MPLRLFHCAKLKNILKAHPELRGHTYSNQNGSFALNETFRNIINMIFMCHLATFNVQNFKKIFRADPEL